MPFDSMPVELKPEQRVLLRAAKIVRRGWCQGVYREGGNYCVLGAIDAAARNYDLADAACLRLEALIGTHAFGTWNDQRGRTAEEVAQALEAAARP